MKRIFWSMFGVLVCGLLLFGQVRTTKVPGDLEVKGVIKGAGFVPASPSSGPSFDWDVKGAALANASITLTAASSIKIDHMASGGTYILKVVQGGSGSYSLALYTTGTAPTCAAWKVINGGSGAITLSTAVGSIDLLSIYFDGTNCYANLGKNYS